jgi:hypothetical protein
MREEAEGRLGALCDRPRADQVWGAVPLSHTERRQPHLRMALEVAVRMARAGVGSGERVALLPPISCAAGP